VRLCQGLPGALATGRIMTPIACLALIGSGVSMPCCCSKQCCDDSGGAVHQSTTLLATGVSRSLIRGGKRSFLSASLTSWQWPRPGRAISFDCDIGGECAEDASDFDRR
jgi:hypothetical protein